jgi:pectate lyase
VKYASLKVTLLVLATGGLIAACASGTDTTGFTAAAGGGEGGTASTSGTPDTATTGGVGGSGGIAATTGATTAAATTGGGGTCVPKCTADSDCQNSCPATQTGINCCDAPSGFCYVASTAMCPMPNPATTSTGSGPY